jgi:hypothetical protein
MQPEIDLDTGAKRHAFKDALYREGGIGGFLACTMPLEPGAMIIAINANWAVHQTSSVSAQTKRPQLDCRIETGRDSLQPAVTSPV